MSELNNKLTRVLHITEMISAAGIESFFMNIYRHIDRNKVQFDFLVLRDQHEFYEDEISSLGGKKFCVVSQKKNTMSRIRDEADKIYSFLCKHDYDIVHIHYTTPLRAMYLKAAKKAGVTTRIYHSHSAYVLGKSKLKLFVYAYWRKKITKWATNYFACSEAAARWMFEPRVINNNKVRVIYNGIEVDKFKYDLNIRVKIRKELNLANKFVLINTGRFTEQKNQLFIIDVLCEIIEDNSNVHLLLLGDGLLMEDVKRKVDKNNLNDFVTFLGVTPNVSQYLCAADCYVMPSLYEGLPVAAVEAECSGLPCVFSENITDEIALTKNVEFLSLTDTVAHWADAIKSFIGKDRKSGESIIRSSGYDVQDVADMLQEFYLLRKENND